MARDEADIIGYTIRHLLNEGVDHIIAADNPSTDSTRAILEDFNRSDVTIVEDNEPGYYQSQKMTDLAFRAGALGAEWVLPFDADELFYVSHLTLGEFFADHPADVIRAIGWDHIATPMDAWTPNPFRRITRRRELRQPLPKVAFRSHPQAVLHMGNHDVDRPGKRGAGLLYRHFQYRSLEQMTRKLRQGKQAYDASDLDEQFGAHWRQGGAQSDNEIRAQWDALGDEPGLLYDPAPYKGDA